MVVSPRFFFPGMHFRNFSPVSYGDLRLWVKPEFGHVSVTGGAVTAISDRSGNGNNGTAVSAPIYIENSHRFNDKPTILFDGIDDYIQFTGSSLTSIQNGTNLPFTIIAAVRAQPNFVDSTICAWSRNNVNGWTRVRITDTDDVVRCRRGADSGTTANPIASQTSYSSEVLSIVCNGTQLSTWHNSVQDQNAVAFSVGAQTIDRFAIGALWDNVVGQFGKIELAELLVYAGAISNSNRLHIEKYMSHRYGFYLPTICEWAGQSNAAHTEPHIVGSSDIEDHVAIIRGTNLSGTSLDNDWQAGSGYGLYEELISSSGVLHAQRYDSFLVWIQGEKDANASSRANNYETNLRQFITDVEAATGFHGVWVIVYLNADYNGGSFQATVRAAQETIVGESAAGNGPAPYRVIGVDPDTLTIVSGYYDGVHYTYPTGRQMLVGLINTALTIHYGW